MKKKQVQTYAEASLAALEHAQGILQQSGISQSYRQEMVRNIAQAFISPRLGIRVNKNLKRCDSLAF